MKVNESVGVVVSKECLVARGVHKVEVQRRAVWW
jgi:hypothetical protein